MLCYTAIVFDVEIAALSDWIVERYPVSPGNGTVWRFTDEDGKYGIVKMTQGGDFFVVSDSAGRELTRIGISKILIAIPLAGAEFFIRYILSRAWRVLASNRIRRDMAEARWLEHNIDALAGILEYGVVVAPRPKKKED